MIERPNSEVMEYLKANAPDIFALVEKDATVGDVHAATSLGSKKKPADQDGGKPSAQSFKALVEQARAAGTLPDGVGKGEEENVEWSIPLDVIKAAPDQQLIFGWASVVEKNGVLVVDKQQDVIIPDDLETAAYDFVLYSRTGGDMHTQKGVSRLVESMVFTKQKQQILGIDLGLVGWWTGWKVDQPELWKLHKEGKRPEFSIGGRGTRVAM